MELVHVFAFHEVQFGVFVVGVNRVFFQVRWIGELVVAKATSVSDAASTAYGRRVSVKKDLSQVEAVLLQLSALFNYYLSMVLYP